MTLDADTRLAAGALAELGALFEEPQTAAAGGFVYVRNAAGGSWLARYQYWEYVKNFMWRIGLAHLGVCLQVSGAFGAFRTRVLREIGGFSGESLVEDYEVIFRLHEQLRLAGAPYRVEVAPDAVAYTEPPETVPAFVHQRTRWFAGFLQTLWTYRRMVGDGRMGLVGSLMLPIKCVDAILPLWGSLSLAILLAAAAGGTAHWQRASLLLFAARWGVDLLLGGLMWRWHRTLFPGRPHALRGPPAGVAHGHRRAGLQLVPATCRPQRLQLVRAPRAKVAPAALGKVTAELAPFRDAGLFTRAYGDMRSRSFYRAGRPKAGPSSRTFLPCKALPSFPRRPGRLARSWSAFAPAVSGGCQRPSR